MSETVLQEAERIVNGARREEYGHPRDNFADIATMWSVILSTPQEPVRVTAENVVDCMIALKLCRAKQGYKRDTFVDIGGYAACRELLLDEPMGVPWTAEEFEMAKKAALRNLHEQQIQNIEDALKGKASAGETPEVIADYLQPGEVVTTQKANYNRAVVEESVINVLDLPAIQAKAELKIKELEEYVSGLDKQIEELKGAKEVAKSMEYFTHPERFVRIETADGAKYVAEAAKPLYTEDEKNYLRVNGINVIERPPLERLSDK